MKPITSSDFASTLEPVLRRSITLEGDAVSGTQPLSDTLQARALVFPVDYTIPRELFNALFSTASQHFPAPVYLSLLERFADESETSDWLVDPDGYEEYRRTVYNLPLEQVLYAGDGSWVLILTTFNYGILGSRSQGFVDDVRAAAPALFDTSALIADFRTSVEAEGHDLRDSWFTELLDHVYGPDEAKRLLSSESM